MDLECKVNISYKYQPKLMKNNMNVEKPTNYRTAALQSERNNRKKDNSHNYDAVDDHSEAQKGPSS